MQQDLYKILNVNKDASAAEIKKQYRKLALQYHPDKNQGNKEAEEKFKEISAANDILSDPEKRKKYDMGGMEAFRQGGGDPMDDIFADFIRRSGFGASPFAHQQQRQRPKQRGGDMRIKITITLEEVFSGVTKKVKMKRGEHCKTCGGRGAKAEDISTCSTCGGIGRIIKQENTIFGYSQIQTTCPVCGGSGQTATKRCDHCSGAGLIPEESFVEFDIPSGIEEGNEIVIRNAGNASREDGGERGDLHIVVDISKHQNFDRFGTTLIHHYQLPIINAILGTDIEIPTIDDKRVRMTVPQGTQSGQRFRLTGKGLPNVYSKVIGDMEVVMNVAIPAAKDLTAVQLKLIKKLKENG